MNDDPTTEETPVDEDTPRTRRQLLTMAGVAAVGGTAMALGHASPAGADNGDPVLAGNTTTATADTTIQTEGAIIGGLSVVNTGAGDLGTGIAAAGGAGAVDIKLNGTGRLAQTPALTGNAKPGFGIYSFNGETTHEIVRSDTGVVWASAGTGTGVNTVWKRMNTPRFDNPSGNGTPFTPFRLLDSRNGQPSVISRDTPLPTNANFDMDIDNLAQIPAGAVGVFGNLTVVSSNYTGFVTLFPTGAAVPTVANINFGTGQLVGNFFQAGLSNTGSLSVRPGDVGGRTVHVIIDIFGYVQ